MEAVEAYYDGGVFVPLSPISAKKNQVAIITILEKSQINFTKKNILSLAGSFNDKDYLEFIEILKDTEKVDSNEW